MRVILMNHHEALVLGDGRDTVTVEPETDGVLTVNGKDYAVSCGGSAPTFDGIESPAARAAFTTAAGVRYKVLAPRIEKKGLVSRLDPYACAIDHRLKIDALEKELEAARAEHRELSGSIRYDALGFITRKQEDKKQ